MLFHSTIRSELGRHFAASLVVLATVVMSIMLIRTLGLASRGSVSPSDVLLVMGFTVLGHLPTLLALSLFIAIVATLSRMYADSEMVIWFSSGMGLAAFARPLVRFAWPIVLAVAVLALVAWPWANGQIEELRGRYERRGDIERVTPGQFQESADGRRVFFIDRDSPDGHQGSNVFISSVENGRLAIISAGMGRLETIDGQRFLMLYDGQRIETPPDGSLAIEISEFERYGVRIKDRAVNLDAIRPAKAVASWALLQNPSPEYKGELAWRVGLVLAAVNLALLALVLTNIHPRASRSGNLLLALLTFVVYYNLINLGQAWIAQQRVGLLTLLLALHGSAFLIGIVWLWMRHTGWHWRRLLLIGRPRTRSLAA